MVKKLIKTFLGPILRNRSNFRNHWNLDRLEEDSHGKIKFYKPTRLVLEKEEKIIKTRQLTIGIVLKTRFHNLTRI